MLIHSDRRPSLQLTLENRKLRIRFDAGKCVATIRPPPYDSRSAEFMIKERVGG